MIETACRKRGIITDKPPDIDNSSELEHDAVRGRQEMNNGDYGFCVWAW
jgi:hypothetical protein